MPWPSSFEWVQVLACCLSNSWQKAELAIASMLMHTNLTADGARNCPRADRVQPI